MSRYSIGYGRQRRRRGLRGVELAESGAESQAGRMLLAAFPRLGCGCPLRTALLFLWDNVGLLGVNNHSKTQIMLFVTVLNSYGIVLCELRLRRRDYSASPRLASCVPVDN